MSSSASNVYPRRKVPVRRVRKKALHQRPQKSGPLMQALTAASRKRRRVGTSATSGRTVSYDDQNQYRQREYRSFVKGRRLTPAAFYRKLIPCGRESEKYEYRNYTLDSVNPNNLRQGLGQENPPGQRFLPMYVFHLTGRPQINKDAPCCFRAFYSTAGPSANILDWTPTNGMDFTGAFVNNNWNLMADSVNGGTLALTKGLLEYVDIRMTLQGPRNQFTRILAQLIQITDSAVDPIEFYNTSTVTPGVSSETHDKFWRQEVAPYTANQCQRYARVRIPGYKVLGSKSFQFQPTSSTENDASGHECHLKWFWRCNRAVDFRRTIGQTLADDLATTNLGDQRDLQCDSAPRPNQRVYLLLRAYAPFAAGGFDNTLHPSFECSIVNKWSGMG